MIYNTILEFNFVSTLKLIEKKRKKYVTKKRIENDALLHAAKEYKFQYKPIRINLKKDVEEIKLMTDGTCIRPDLYLNNDNTCVKCPIFNICCCSIKTLGKKKKIK